MQDGSGAISSKELLYVMRAMGQNHKQHRNKDGFISMKKIKKVTTMLGANLGEEELDEFMKEADLVRWRENEDITESTFISGWKWKV